MVSCFDNTKAKDYNLSNILSTTQLTGVALTHVFPAFYIHFKASNWYCNNMNHIFQYKTYWF